MDILTILRDLGIFTIGTISVVSVIGYITKSIFNNYLDKRVELYKNELLRENENFRAELERKNTEHQIKFSTLHADRINAIKTLHSSFAELRQELIKYNKDTEKHNLDYEQNPVFLKMNEVHNIFIVNKIYFSEELAKKIEAFVGTFSVTASLAVFFSKNRDKWLLVRKTEPEKELQQKEFIDLLDESKILLELENEFRNIIGVGG